MDLDKNIICYFLFGNICTYDHRVMLPVLYAHKVALTNIQKGWDHTEKNAFNPISKLCNTISNKFNPGFIDNSKQKRICLLINYISLKQDILQILNL